MHIVLTPDSIVLVLLLVFMLLIVMAAGLLDATHWAKKQLRRLYHKVAHRS